jgi:hypothetical protein
MLFQLSYSGDAANSVASRSCGVIVCGGVVTPLLQGQASGLSRRPATWFIGTG